MDFYQIRYFLAVAKTGTFSKAAERAFVTQPTLSAGIKKLEGDLGVRLFERGPRRASLTPEGARFLNRARVIRAEIAEARAELKAGARDRRLRVGLLRTLAPDSLGRLVRAWRGAVANTELALKDGTVAELEAWLAQGRIDAALTVLPRAGRGARATPLFRSRQVLMVAAGDPWAARGRVPLADLDDAPFVLRAHCEFDAESRRIFNAGAVRPRILYRTDRDDRALAMVASGLGATVGPDRLRRPGVVQVEVPELRLSHTIGLRRGEPDPAGLDRLAHLARSHDWRAPAADLEWLR